MCRILKWRGIRQQLILHFTTSEEQFELKVKEARLGWTCATERQWIN